MLPGRKRTASPLPSRFTSKKKPSVPTGTGRTTDGCPLDPKNTAKPPTTATLVMAGGADGDDGGGAGGGATIVSVSTAESLAVLFPATPAVVIVAVAVFVAVEPGCAFGSIVAAMAYVTLLPAG